MQHKRRNTLLVLNETFHGYRRYVLLLIVLGFFGAALDGISINAIVPILSFLLNKGAVPTDFISQGIAHLFGFIGVPFKFRYLLAFVAILFFVRAIALAVSTYIRGNITASFMAREMSALFRATMCARWPFIIGQKAGYLQNTVFWDVKRSTQLLDVIVQFVQSGTGALMYFIVALNISPIVTMITLATGALIVLALRRPLLGKAYLFGEETSKAEKLLASHITEYFQGFKTVKALNATNGVVHRASSYLERLRHAQARGVFIQGLGSVIMQPLSFLFIIGVFSFSYTSGTFNFATFAANRKLISAQIHVSSK